MPIAGDWDGDGDDNLGIYRPSEQMFYLFTSTCTGSPVDDLRDCVNEYMVTIGRWSSNVNSYYDYYYC